MTDFPGLNTERFWSHVSKPRTNGCWEWTAARSADGYGRYTIRFNGTKRTMRAHRLAYELQVAPIAEGLTLDHTCGNRACVNPTHLEPVTQRENVLRGTSFASRQAAQTHCKNGHEFTPENTYIRGRHRWCRVCRRDLKQRWDAAQKAKR